MTRPLSTARDALIILKLFTTEHPDWGVRELAERLGWSRSTTHALMKTLASEGFLMQSADRRYRLGWALFELGGVFLSRLELREEALPVMRRLNERFDETVHLATLDRGDVVYIEKVTAPRSMQLVTRMGLRYPSHCTGVGKMLLAYAPDEVLTSLNLVATTPRTITDLEVLRVELSQIRQDQVAYDREEALLGLSCVAVPIHNYLGEVIAGLSLSVPTARFRSDETGLTIAVREASADISRALGYRPNTHRYRFALPDRS